MHDAIREALTEALYADDVPLRRLGDATVGDVRALLADRDALAADNERMKRRECLYVGPDCGVIITTVDGQRTTIPLCRQLREDRDALARDLAAERKLADDIFRAREATLRDLAAARGVIDQVARVMRGEGVEDQGEAWDRALRLLDAHLAATAEREPGEALTRNKLIAQALDIIRQDYSKESAAMASRQEYVADAVRQLVDAGYRPTLEREPWPFAESPAEIARRMERALAHFGDMLPAVRNVFIERDKWPESEPEYQVPFGPTAPTTCPSCGGEAERGHFLGCKRKT